MNIKENIAKKYLRYLQNGDIEEVINLFDENGIVESPIYGTQNASDFYTELKNDTANSTLNLIGIFEQKNATSLALYFTYIWTLKNNQKVEFDVVDIIEFNELHKIQKLKIIYDTVTARKLVTELKKE